MTKKEYVLKVLDKVIPYWEEAKYIKENILSWIATNEYMDDIYQKCVAAVNIVLQHQSENKSQQLSQYLQSLQQQEKLSQHADQEDIKKLEELLAVL